MTKEYETIIEHVLEAKDKGISLATLLETYPEQKGEYSDAWKFVEGVHDHMNKNIRPDKNRFYSLIHSLPERKPVLSHFMPYIAVATPALILLFVVFTYTSPKNPDEYTPSVATQNNPVTPEIFDASLLEQSGENSDAMSSMMAKSAPVLLSQADSPLDSAISSFENAYSENSSLESTSTIRFASSTDYNNLSSLYE